MEKNWPGLVTERLELCSISNAPSSYGLWSFKEQLLDIHGHPLSFAEVETYSGSFSYLHGSSMATTSCSPNIPLIELI